jgi:hypothetical protein
VRSASPSSGDLLRIEAAIDLALVNLLSPAVQQYLAEIASVKDTLTLSGKVAIDFPN